MLLPKPLTTFLAANTSPQIPTLLLTTPTGKLLSSSSPLPGTTIRAQATLASSLWDLYVPVVADGTIASALPQSSITANDESDLTSILIQLTHGTMVIKMLKCSLLFVAIAAPVYGLPSSLSSQHLGIEVSGSPGSVASESGSVMTAASRRDRMAGLKVLRRQVEEIGKYLDEDLKGFELGTVL